MAWSLLSHTAAVAGSNSTVTTSPIDTTGASVIVVFAGGLLNSVLTDSMANTNLYRLYPRPSASGYGLNAYVIVNPLTNASHTFTYALGSSFPNLAVLAFAGAFGGAEKTTSNYTASGTTVLPGSITPTTDNALLVTGYNDGSTTGTRSINASFTLDDSLSGNAFSGSVATAHLIQTSAAAANPTWTTTTSGAPLATMVSILLRSAGGGEQAHPF